MPTRPRSGRLVADALGHRRTARPAPVDRDHRHPTPAGEGRPGLAALVGRLRRTMTTASRPRRSRCARPIRSPRLATTTVDLPGPGGTAVPVTVTVGIAKGVGMIHPDMATMLSVVLTDATVEPAVLLVPAPARCGADLGSAVRGRRHEHERHGLRPGLRRIGRPAGRGISGRRDGARRRAIEAVARDLARQQAADGEGATILITAQVSGARDDAAARAVARAVISSQPGQGGGPRQGPELGPDRGRRRQRRARPRGGPGGSGLEPDESRRCAAVGRSCWHPTCSGSRSPVTSSSTAPRAARWRSITRPPGRP